MNLSAKPTSFLCPYCGEWHPCFNVRHLSDHNSKDHSITFMCHHSFRGKTSFYFENDICHFSTEPICQKARMNIDFKIPVSDFVSEGDSNCYTFGFPFKSFDYVGTYGCRNCPEFLRKKCQLPKLGDEGDHVNMIIKTGFNFSN